MLKYNTIFEDKRGKIITVDNEMEYVDEIYSYSKKNVFRGLHGDNITTKKIICLHGKINVYLISMLHGWKKEFILDNPEQIFIIPPNMLLGFLCKSKECIVNYKLSSKYNIDNQYSVSYKGIFDLPKNIIISDRDEKAKTIKDLRELVEPSKFLNKNNWK